MDDGRIATGRAAAVLRGGALPALLLVCLAACSRTYDGTLVPTYRFGVARFHGLPLLTIEQTPLETPVENLPPVPPPAADIVPSVEERDLPPPPKAGRARPRREARRPAVPAPGAAGPASPLACRPEKPEGRTIRMVCE